VYVTDPPVNWIGPGKCTEEVMVPVHGFRLAPGGLVRVWIVVQAVQPGHFATSGQLVRYTQGGTQYQQLIPEGYDGQVSRTAPFIPVESFEARCLKIVKTRLLAGHYFHKPQLPAGGRSWSG
jgi:hypothetical protein